MPETVEHIFFGIVLSPDHGVQLPSLACMTMI